MMLKKKKNPRIQAVYDKVAAYLPGKVIQHEEIRIALSAFFIVTAIVVFLSFVMEFYFKPAFLENILVEAHGMIMDIFVIGFIMAWLIKKGEKNRQIQSYIDEIDDFRYWVSEEATYRIRGNIRRLNRNDVANIILTSCYLKGVNLGGVNLQKAHLNKAHLENASLVNINLQDADLSGANFKNADLAFSNLQYANLQSTDLRFANLFDVDLRHANLENTDLEAANLINAKFSTIEQFSKAKTLYAAKIDEAVIIQIKNQYPHLFVKPDRS